YVWLYQNGPFAGTANWMPDSFIDTDQTGYIDMSFPKGQLLAQWLQYVGASTTLGQIPLQELRSDVTSVIPPTQQWLYVIDPTMGQVPVHFTFNAPVGGPAAQQSGRVVFTASPLFTTNPEDVPNEPSGGKTAQQYKRSEYIIFRLPRGVRLDISNCTPQT